MMLYRLFGWLIGYQAYGLTYLMFGLLMACLYVIYDTQLIIERAERGDKDVVAHTMTLFFDLLQLFVKILQILLELKKNEENKKKNKK